MFTSAALAFTLLAGGIPADMSPADDLSKARTLVKQLGDARFKVRDAAEKGLLDLGMASLPALKEGEKSADVHVQDRCRALQPVVRDLTRRQLIEDFIADKQGVNVKELPLAELFLKAAGDSKESRALFATVIEQNGPLMELLSRDKVKGPEQYALHCQEIARQSQRLGQRSSVTQVDAALHMLVSLEFAGDKTGRISANGYWFLQSPALKESLSKDSAENSPLRKLFLAWLEKEPQSYMVQQALQVAVDSKMSEAVPFILKSIKQKSGPIYERAQVALLLVKVGDKDHSKDLAPLLDDKTVVGHVGANNKQGQVQLRDVALAISIKLNGQKMADYDFDMMQGNEENIAQSYINCAFSTSEKREAAHKKFKEFVEKQDKK